MTIIQRSCLLIAGGLHAESLGASSGSSADCKLDLIYGRRLNAVIPFVNFV